MGSQLVTTTVNSRSPKLNMTTDVEYIKIAGDALEEAIEIANSTDGWKEEKKDDKTGDIVESKKNKSGRKIYRCKAKINIPPKLLIEAISDTDHVTGWNGVRKRLCLRFQENKSG